jgi:hypothetical protein
MNWKIRESRESDLPFILKSWMVSFRKFSSGAKADDRIFYKRHQELIKIHIQQVPALMAVANEDDDQIIGYVHLRGDVINYMYTKEAFENLGVAKSLLSVAMPNLDEIHVSHWTEHMYKLRRNHRVIYDPYSFFQVEGFYV